MYALMWVLIIFAAVFVIFMHKCESLKSKPEDREFESLMMHHCELCGKTIADTDPVVFHAELRNHTARCEWRALFYESPELYLDAFIAREIAINEFNTTLRGGLDG